MECYATDRALYFSHSYKTHNTTLYYITPFSLPRTLIFDYLEGPHGVTFNSRLLSPTSQQNNTIKKNKNIFLNSTLKFCVLTSKATLPTPRKAIVCVKRIFGIGIPTVVLIITRFYLDSSSIFCSS